MAKYPIYIKPTPEFEERLAAVMDQRYEVDELVFVQWRKARFSAQWYQTTKGQRWSVEMSLGGAEPSLEAIQSRLLKFLKSDPTT